MKDIGLKVGETYHFSHYGEHGIYSGKENWKNGQEWETFYNFRVDNGDWFKKRPDQILRYRILSQDILKVVETDATPKLKINVILLNKINSKDAVIKKYVHNGDEHLDSVKSWLKEVKKIQSSKGEGIIFI